MLQQPALLLSLLLASAYAMAFYLLKGRGLRDLLFLWLASVVGFGSGQVAGQILDLVPWTIGEVHVVEGSFVALLFLVVARWLTRGKSA
jgi:hypothetical protein